MQLNKNIKLIRELSGKTQDAFAKIIQTKKSNLKTYETTNVRPKANILADIADIAGITVDDLENKKLTHKDITIKLPVEKVKKVVRETGESIVEEEYEHYGNKGTDDKYIRLLERDRIFFETSLKENLNLITVNLTELLKAQRYDRAQLTTLLSLASRTLAAISNQEVEKIFDETNKAVADLIREQM